VTATLSRTLLAAAVATACLVAPGCSSSSTGRAAPPVPAVQAMTPRTSAEVPFERAWELQLPGRIERSWIGEQLPDLVFFQIADTHEIHCVDARSGVTRWISETFRHQILGDAFVHHQMQPGEREKEVIIDDRLYIIVDDTLYCLDIGTGQRIWHLILPFAPSTGPMAAGATEGNLRIFIGDWNNKIQVVGIHQPNGERQRKFPYVVWQMNTPAPVLAQGVENEELVYIGDSSGSIRCLKLDRNIVWEVATGGAIDGGVTTRGRVLYAGNDGNAVHALNRLTGERLGQINLQGPVRKRPFWFANEPDRLYVWVDSPDHNIGGLVALRAQPDNIAFSDGGKHAIEVVRLGEAWRVPGATRLLASTPLQFLLSDGRSGMVWAVHRGTGALQWTWDLNQGWPKPQATVEHIVVQYDRSDALRTLIAADDTGSVMAYRMYGFVPTPAQEAAGLTSRNLAEQATDKPKPAVGDKAAEPAPADK
jgi:hypothetical protein